MSQTLAHPIAEAARLSGLSRSKLYVEIAAGRLEARKAGAKTLILAESLRDYLAALPRVKATTLA